MPVELPEPIAQLADELAAGRGVRAVVLGGSRAVGRATPASDWDLGVYYAGEPDLAALRARGEVHLPGSWGRLMNGGSWLQIDGLTVDVLLRDVAAVAHWTAQASAGRFEIDGLPGYVAGIPTYSLAAEAASCLVVRGTLAGSFDVMEVPDALAEMGPTKWRFNRDFSLYHAAAHAARGNVAATVGQVARAALEEAHARCCAGRRWVLNEKHLMAAADMGALDAGLLARPVLDDLAAWVDAVRASLPAS